MATSAPTPDESVPRVRRGSAAAFACGLAAVTALALWVVWPAFDPGRILNMDAPRHLLRTIVMARQFLPSGHVDGWSPWWFLGAQLFLFQSYGYFFLIGGSALLLERYVSLEHVFKLWYVLPILVLPAATALMARRLGVARRGALAAALASLVFSSPQGYGVQGVFGIGLLLQGVGIIAFAFAWPEILAALGDRRRAPWFAVLLLAALVLCHFISGAYAMAVSGLAAAWLALRARDAFPLVRYALIVAVVLLLAGHSLFPSLELRDMSGGAVGWGNDRDRFQRFFAGTLFGAPPLALAAIAAAVWSLRYGGQALAISAGVFLATGLLAGSNEQPWEPQGFAHLLEILVRPRALPYAALFQAVFAGVAFDVITTRTETAFARVGRPAAMFALPVAVAVLVGIGVPRIIGLRHFVHTEYTLKDRDRQVYRKLVTWLRHNVKPPAVVAVPRVLFPGRVAGARSVISLLNMDTGLYTLYGDQAELSRSSRHYGRVDLDRLHIGATRAAATLRAAGVSYVILSNLEVRSHLARNAQFELVYEYNRAERRRTRPQGEGKGHSPLGFSIYRVNGGGVWLHAPGLDVQSMQYAPERITWDVRSGDGSGKLGATTAVNWHPDWAAWADGVRVPTRCSPARRVAFDVPAGTRTVKIEFVRSLREKAYNAISAVTLAAVLVAWWRDLRARRRARGIELPDGESVLIAGQTGTQGGRT